MTTPIADDGRRRVVIENVTPDVDAGRFPAKRSRGERVIVEADIFADAASELGAVLLFKRDGAAKWEETRLMPLGNDRWRGAFTVNDLGRHVFSIRAWVDPFRTWRSDLKRRLAAKQDVGPEIPDGVALIRQAAAAAPLTDRKSLESWAHKVQTAAAAALDDDLAALMLRHGPRPHVSEYVRQPAVMVDPPHARFCAWYEIFPRSCSPDPGAHGTFRDVEALLPTIAAMGFDIVYLPPIHPIGRSFRKGPNNTPSDKPKDPGSPWAIGGAEGGHKAIHPALGTPDDFRRLNRAAREHGMHLAIDVAFQVSPDHPYVATHPEWFRKRPDGSIRYAENPPKKYQDIYPLDFECAAWPSLWQELKSIFDHWIEQGVTVFRVDNPHTKPFSFWEWCLGDIRSRHPEVLFLSEAFTRPRVMTRLSKLGFNQSYTYFPWRTGKAELTDYLTELTQTPVREFFRPSQWTNTPDILIAYLQEGGRPAFAVRLALAATLGANYGMYGPAFELCEGRPIAPGSEEYLDSEKYQIRRWDRDRPDSLRPLITRINRIRRDNDALHNDWSLEFHPTDNDMLIAYSKNSLAGGASAEAAAHEMAAATGVASGDAAGGGAIVPRPSNAVLVVVNLDPARVQSGWVEVLGAPFGAEPGDRLAVRDLLSDERYDWTVGPNFVKLDPSRAPAHILLVEPAGMTTRSVTESTGGRAPSAGRAPAGKGGRRR